MQYVATCLFGLERYLGEEIEALGLKKLETMDGRVCFEAPLEAVARCNIFFRYAERLFIKLGDFENFNKKLSISLDKILYPCQKKKMRF